MEYAPYGAQNMALSLAVVAPIQPIHCFYRSFDQIGYVGTYTVEWNKITHHVLTSSRPEFVGSDQIRYFEVRGNTLIIRTAPIKAVQSGQDVVATLAFEKIE